jgi:hypothetical protein
MPLVLANRVQQTGTANTTVSFTLTGAVAGFQSFAVIGNGNTTYYSSTDASGNWEVGLGTYSTTGPTLTRTTVYASSNSNLAVTFSGAVSVFVTYPSGRSVNLDGSGNVSALGTVSSGTWQGSTIGVAYGGTGQTTYTNGQILIGNTTGNTLVKATLTAGCGVTITNGAGSITISAASVCPATPGSPGIVYGETTVCCPNGKAALGYNAGAGNAGVAVGYTAGAANSAVAVGFSAYAYTNAVSIGHDAGANSCGSIAIGKSASVGACCITSINTIAIGTNTFGSNNDRTFIGPIRSTPSSGLQTLYYNACTREVTSDTSIGCATPTVPGRVFGTTCICNSRTALGFNAGLCNQGAGGVAIGTGAGATNQVNSSVAIGFNAGAICQGFTLSFGEGRSVAIGQNAGYSSQGRQSVAVGLASGYGCQGEYAVAVGAQAGQYCQGNYAVAIGYSAGSFCQGSCSVAIGVYSSSVSNSVAIGLGTSSVSLCQTHIGPIRNATTCFALYYCPCTREITYG